jgi:hypothetical protein
MVALLACLKTGLLVEYTRNFCFMLPVEHLLYVGIFFKTPTKTYSTHVIYKQTYYIGCF